MYLRLPEINVYIDNFIGTRLAEYEVFVQHYKSLILFLKFGSLEIALELYGYIHHHIMTIHHWIVEYFGHTMGMDHSDTELLLAIIAMELHCGRTSSFHEMLAFLNNSIYNENQYLAEEIRLQVKTFDPHKSSGMYTSMHIITIIHSLT